MKCYSSNLKTSKFEDTHRNDNAKQLSALFSEGLTMKQPSNGAFRSNSSVLCLLIVALYHSLPS